MNLIFCRNNLSSSHSIRLSRNHLILSFLIVIFVPALIGGSLVYWIMDSKIKLVKQDASKVWQAELNAQKDEVARIKQQSLEKIDSLTPKIGELQARLIRLDALGKRLTSVANLSDEFDFDQPPPMGGPEDSLEEAFAYTDSELTQALDLLTNKIEQRQQQLELIQSLLTNRNLADQVYIAGRPIKKGWMSSPYGRRTDPFTGRSAWHGGIDFAGKQDSEVIATGAGVVVFAGPRSGFGNLIEIDHGDGYLTRYAHLNKFKAQKGDLVQRGETVGLMGCTGRCTGPHVHYEVLYLGRTVDPITYVSRTAP